MLARGPRRLSTQNGMDGSMYSQIAVRTKGGWVQSEQYFTSKATLKRWPWHNTEPRNVEATQVGR